jgi:hypothetical protein
MTLLNLNNLNDLIKERKNLYQNHPDEVVAAFNREVESTNAYNGRQVLELIQNADDAQAGKMTISFDDGKIRFINDGEPFSFEGIKSLMIANLSNKVTSSYIGNKGLGFRAILNWASKVTIYSAGLAISFSKEYARQVARELKINLDLIRDKRHLSADCVPFPTLGIPDVKEDTAICSPERGCCIEIEYDPKYEDDIHRQLESIDGKTLLFLQHIRQINKPEDELIIKRDGSSAAIEGQTWKIYTREGKLPSKYQDPTKNDEKKYAVKIAVCTDEGVCVNYSTLYNYLPTQEHLDLPFIMHATVDLESARNHINESEVNRYILGQATELVYEIANQYLGDGEPASWKAYLMMTPAAKSSSTIMEKAFYELLRQKRDTLAIFPTVSGSYCKKTDYYFFDEPDSEFWSDKSHLSSPLDAVLKPGIDLSYWESRIPSWDSYSRAINEYSRQASIEAPERANLIVHLLKIVGKHYPQADPVLHLLTDPSGSIIDSDYVFLPKKGDVDYDLPSFVSLSFLQNELYDSLKDKLKESIADNRTENDSEDRCLSRILSKITPVSEYDKSAIARALVLQVRNRLKSTTDDAEEILYIKAMVSALFAMRGETALENVPLINQAGNVVGASDLLLDTDYNRWIFGDQPDRYVQPKDYWGIDDDDSFFRFMRFLGVNAWTKSGKGCDSKDYFNYLVRNERKQNEDVPAWAFLERTEKQENTHTRILHLDWLEQLDLNQIILLLNNEPKLQTGLEEEINWCFDYKKTWRSWRTRFNFVRFELTQLPKLKNTIFGDGLVLAKGFARTDLTSRSVSDHSLDHFLSLLQTDLTILSDGELTSTINSLKDIDPNGDKAQRLYTLLVQTLGDRQLPRDREIWLYCRDGNYHPRGDVYYSNNTCVPEKVVSGMGLFRLSYPSRQGSKVCDFFGVKSPDQIGISLRESTDSSLSAQFSKSFETIKPYILLYALKAGRVKQNATQKSYANDLRACSIHLLKSGQYSIRTDNGDDPTFASDSNPLQLWEFIGIQNDYYVCIGDETQLDRLKGTPIFCNAFAEIIGMALKLESRNDDFIYLLQNLEFKLSLDQDRFTKEEKDECFELMGLSREERRFWSEALNVINVPVDESWSKEKLYEVVSSNFSIGVERLKRVDYYRWSNEDSIHLLEMLEDRVGEEKLSALLTSCGITLYDWFAQEYRQLLMASQPAFKTSLWHLCLQDKDRQKDFLQLLFDYDHLTLDQGKEYRSLSFDCAAQLESDVRERFFGIDLKQFEPEKHDNLYKSLVSDEEDMPLDIQSLRYFPENEQVIKSWMASEQNVQDQKRNVTDSERNDEIECFFIDPARLSEGESAHHTTNGKRATPVTHSSKREAEKAKQGEMAEKVVKRYFEKNNIPFRWRSSFSDQSEYRDDGAGYDFEYEKDGKWRFLEVKDSSNNSFIISENEYHFANKDENINLYDMALVSGNRIRIIPAFFTGDYTKSEKDLYISFKED